MNFGVLMLIRTEFSLIAMISSRNEIPEQNSCPEQTDAPFCINDDENFLFCS